MAANPEREVRGNLAKPPSGGGTLRCPDPGCGAENPAGQRFCGQCGQPLDPGVEKLVEWAVARRLDTVLKDRKVIEVETAAAIASRLIGWAKIYGTILGGSVAI